MQKNEISDASLALSKSNISYSKIILLDHHIDFEFYIKILSHSQVFMMIIKDHSGG